jgi:hypothetical protein
MHFGQLGIGFDAIDAASGQINFKIKACLPVPHSFAPSVLVLPQRNEFARL